MPTNNKPATTAPKPEESKPVENESVVQQTPKPQVEVMTLRQRRNEEMNDRTSDLRNQVDVEHMVDFQLLSNTPAEMICAMSGWSLEKLGARAKELETTLKGSLAGTMNP